MASDADWVEDVKRWYFAGQRHANAAPVRADAALESDETLGYEAADPALQARYWPDAPGAVREPTPLG